MLFSRRPFIRIHVPECIIAPNVSFTRKIYFFFNLEMLFCFCSFFFHFHSWSPNAPSSSSPPHRLHLSISKPIRTLGRNHKGASPPLFTIGKEEVITRSHCCEEGRRRRPAVYSRSPPRSFGRPSATLALLPIERREKERRDNCHSNPWSPSEFSKDNA